jgi:hypothetical protein
MPEEVELVLTRPAGFDGLSDREVLEIVRAEVGRREALHREKGKARRMPLPSGGEYDWRYTPMTVSSFPIPHSRAILRADACHELDRLRPERSVPQGHA